MTQSPDKNADAGSVNTPADTAASTPPRFTAFEQALLKKLDDIQHTIRSEAQSTRRTIATLDTHLTQKHNPKLAESGLLTGILHALESNPDFKTRIKDDWIFDVTQRDDSWGIHVKILNVGKYIDLGSDGTVGSKNIYRTLEEIYRSAILKKDDSKQFQIANMLSHIRQGLDVLVRVDLVNRGGPSSLTIKVEKDGETAILPKQWTGSNNQGVSKQIYYEIRHDPLLLADMIIVHETDPEA